MKWQLRAVGYTVGIEVLRRKPAKKHRCTKQEVWKANVGGQATCLLCTSAVQRPRDPWDIALGAPVCRPGLCNCRGAGLPNWPAPTPMAPWWHGF